MPKIIQDWLGTRLGMLLDMSPQKFGRNTKDGKLLAKLLYSYGVIPLQIFEKIHDCTTCYDCLNNLFTLKPYLVHIGVNHDDSTFEKMAGGDGTAAISVFYAIYLVLERKSRLRYITSLKERNFLDGCCTRFKVDWVPEKALKCEPVERETKLAMPLVENVDLIKLHKEKCKEVIESVKRAKKKFETISANEAKLGPVVSKYVTSQPLDKRKTEAEATMEDINNFSKKHPETCGDLNYSQLVELKKKYENAPTMHPCLMEGNAIMGNIKRRKRGEIFAQSFQQKLQQMLLDEQWKQIVEKQDKDFEDKLCANLLKQSQYEKQMVTKLHMIKHQKKVIMENRRMVECLKIEQEDKDYDRMLHKKAHLRIEDLEEQEFERKRIAELHRRAYDNKARMRNARLRNESRKICESLVDIAIRIAEIRERTGCQVPKAFMKDMKELFFKDLSIFDILEHSEELYDDNKIQLVDDTEYFGEDGVEQYFQVDADYELMKNQEMERQTILNECDLNDYINLSGPWMVELLFPDNTEAEGKHLILAYIVHKLLEIKYPCQNKFKLVQIRHMKPTAAVVNFKDPNAMEMFIDLMELRDILVVKVEDAINYVLLAYKEDLLAVNDIDIRVEGDNLEVKTVLKEKEENRKLQLLKRTTPETSTIDDELSFADKQTQTPRMIPEEDIVLTSDAEIGKHAFEALAAGDPVPDPVIISAIVAYVKSKEDHYGGWVLVNYPVLYSQARELEFSLIGYYSMPALDEMESLEEAEGFTYRGPWGDAYTRDNRAYCMESKLVPKPDYFTDNLIQIPKTYFNSFIRITGPQTVAENFEHDYGPLEKFYDQQGTFLNFEYQNLSFQTVKNLGKVIITGQGDSVSGVFSKTSIECFGSGVLELNEKWEPKKKTEKEGMKGIKKVSIEPVNPPVFAKEEEQSELEVSLKEELGEALPSPLPGEPGWEWAEGPQPEEYVLALASLWENMEAVYLEDLKTVFFCLRAHRSNVLNYNTCIRQSIRTLMRRPDEKQKVLSEFQKMYNEIDPDLRPDVDVKCELHVRVSELEQVLMSIADERKMNSQRDLIKVAQDNWVPDEMAHLTNIYLTALQLEADRCVGTVQLIMDYYTLLQQKIPEEKVLEKLNVPKINIQNGKYTLTISSSKGDINLSPKASEMKRGKLEQSKEKLKSRSFMDKKRRGSDGSDLPGAAEVITQILTSLTLPEDSLTPFHNFFVDTIKNISSNVKNVLEECLMETKKSDKALTTAKAGKNGKKVSDMRVVPANLLTEWSAALEDEMNRFFFRAKLLLARGIFEMNEFLTTILNILSSLSDDITDMYMKEIHSISECCKVFRCSIEEEKGIRPELELKEDEFIVNMDMFLFNVDEEEYVLEKETQSKFTFSVEQLSLLRSKLQMVAPDGEIIKRSLIYIFEDLKTLNPEAGQRCFSETWDDIEPSHLVNIFDYVYLNLEIVNWKDFIIYALDLPVPTTTEILEARSNFRKFDPLLSELISRESYEKVHLWFETSLTHASLADRYEKARILLFEMYQVNEHQTNYSALLLAFCKDLNPVDGFIKALALAEGKKVSKGVSERTSLMEEDAGEYLFGDYKLGTALAAWKPSTNRCCAPGISGNCIPKTRIKCTCTASEESSVKDMVTNAGGLEGEGGEDNFFFEYEYQTRVPYVSFRILTSLLKASFPSLPQLSLLLDCSQTFQETLNSVYDSLEPVNGKIEVNKLIKHKFINRLLHTTNKFKFLSLQSILQAEANLRMKTSACTSDRLALMKCLNLKERIFS